MKSSKTGQKDIKNLQTEQNEGVLDDIWIEEALASNRVKDYVLDSAFGKEYEERESTKRKKALFLEVYARTMGTITLACDKAGISRTTFYEWKEVDGEFGAKLIKIENQRVDMVEDRLFKLIQENDGPSIRWYLEKVVAKYKARQVLEHHTDDKTFEDVVQDVLNAMENNGKHTKPENKG